MNAQSRNIKHLLSGPLALALLLALTLAACDSTDPGDEGEAGEQEVISNVTLTMTPSGGGAAVTAEAVFNSAGEQESIETIALEAGQTYDGAIDLRNRFADGEEADLTAEVRAEAAEHQFFYALTGASGVSLTVTDQETDYAADAADSDELREGVPVGLTFDVVAGAAGNGQLQVVLGHYDERLKEVDESLDDTPERDIDIAFPVEITAAR